MSSRRRTRWSTGATTACIRSASRTPFIPTDAFLTASRRSTRSGGSARRRAPRPAPVSPSLPTTTASLTRRVAFSAAHRYRRPEWTDARNRAVFGDCARANYHGHTYTCDVTVAGQIDGDTGMIVDLGLLDRVLATEIRDRFDHRNINLDVPEFADGRLIPTGENLARVILGLVQSALGGRAHVTEVRVAEDATLWATVRADDS